jgi:hypothetical protein
LSVALPDAPVQNKSLGFAACGRGLTGELDEKMHPRLRSFIGTILIIILVIVYALAATTVASLLLATSPWWVHFLYFLLSGLLWILPAMVIIKWMAGPRPPRA